MLSSNDVIDFYKFYFLVTFCIIYVVDELFENFVWDKVIKLIEVIKLFSFFLSIFVLEACLFSLKVLKILLID